jgi:hypothetical protein
MLFLFGGLLLIMIVVVVDIVHGVSLLRRTGDARSDCLS